MVTRTCPFGPNCILTPFLTFQQGSALGIIYPYQTLLSPHAHAFFMPVRACDKEGFGAQTSAEPEERSFSVCGVHRKRGTQSLSLSTDATGMCLSCCGDLAV